MTKSNKLIYIYVLVDQDKFQRSKDIIKSAIYVGKGTGARMDAHIQEAKLALQDKSRLDTASNPEKVKQLVAMLEEGKQIKAYRISAGYSTDEDAFIAEALAITLINSSRSEDERLLNAVSGHGSTKITDMVEHFLFAGCTDVTLPETSDTSAIFVKVGGDGDFYKHEHEEEEKISGITKMSEGQVKKSKKRREEKLEIRRGWDPMEPWNNEEATERARRYWPFKEERVIEWINNPAKRPKFLFAGIKDGNKTVVRYIWEIDWSKNLEHYPGNRWGFPLKEEATPSAALKAVQEQYLGACLYNPVKEEDLKDKKKQITMKQALSAYAHGVRIIRI